ncbi:unnamed protein product, partial [Ixodes hexagonus]
KRRPPPARRRSERGAMKAAAGPLLALALLAFSLVACGARGLGHKTPIAPQRTKRSLRWQEISDSGPDDNSRSEDSPDDSNTSTEDISDSNSEYQGGSGYIDQMQISYPYQEEWLMDSFLPRIQMSKIRQMKNVPYLSKYKLFPSDAGQESVQAPPLDSDKAGPSTSSVEFHISTSTNSPSLTSPSEEPSEAASRDTSSTNTLMSASATWGPQVPQGCPPGVTANSPRTGAIKIHVTPEKKHSKLKSAKAVKTTREFVSATRKVKISAVASAPLNDSGTFMINRYAQVHRQSAYMEYMDPMKSYACRVHVWIIVLLCALLLLLTVLHLVSRAPALESPPLESPLAPLSPPIPVVVKHEIPTEIWEDDIYNVSETVKMGRSPSLEGHESVH